jgi:LPS export ABC transporter protein LptC
MWRVPVKIILVVVIFFVVGGIILILTSYRYWLKPESLVNSNIESHIDIGLKTVHHVALKKGIKLWDLTSESVQRIDAQNHVTPLTLTFYPHTGKPIMLNAGHGTVKDNKDIEINGNIIIKQPPWQFVCDSITYSYSQHEIAGKNNIAITGRGLTITAKAMNYDLSSGQLTINESVCLTLTEPASFETGHSK